MQDYQVYAIRYASNGERRSSENFLRGDPHDTSMPMDFFVWAVVNDERCIVVDTGFAEDRAEEEGYRLSRPVAAGLRAVGIEPQQVDAVVITHFHWDHAGNHHLFPRARYHLQEREMRFCTGPCMCRPWMRAPFKADDVTQLVTKVFQDRVQFHDGDGEVAPGVTVHRVGGHTEGIQVVRVRTARGWVVLASDVAHYYANLHQKRPYPTVDSMRELLAGFERVEALADSADHVIPGHDPLVLAKYPSAGEGIVRVDLAPRAL